MPCNTLFISLRMHISGFSSGANLKVNLFQNEFMKSSFLPKYERKIVRISALCKFWQFFDNFLFIFWQKQWPHSEIYWPLETLCMLCNVSNHPKDWLLAYKVFVCKSLGELFLWDRIWDLGYFWAGMYYRGSLPNANFSQNQKWLYIVIY